MARNGIAAVLKEKKDPVSLEKMTLLDFFAALAAIGAVSLGDAEQTAKQAYEVAEAMIEERASR